MNSPYTILAAGIGSRSGSRFHKCLQLVGRKAVLSHIIDTIPIGSRVVMVLGYQAGVVRDYCLLAHPEREFTFVVVPDYTIGPGVSLLSAREILQEPFYLCCCDSVIQGELPNLNSNWISVFPTQESELYSTCQIDQLGQITGFTNKGISGYPWGFSGLCGIKDYQTFWTILQENISRGDTEFVNVFSHYKRWSGLGIYPAKWNDTGTQSKYRDFYHKKNEHWILEKDNEERTYHIGNQCIKLYLDPQICKNKIERAWDLKDFLPTIQRQWEYGFSYLWEPGLTMYEVEDLSIWSRLLDWLYNDLWVEMYVKNFSSNCMNFYREKTYSRLSQIDYPSGEVIINGEFCPPLSILLAQLDWEDLSDGIACLGHGDCQPANIIWNGSGFVLIDWRDSFDGITYVSDCYYDLAKLHSGLVISLDRALREDPDITIGYTIEYKDFNHSEKILLLVERCIAGNGYDLGKVRTLSALVHLNMAALHVGPLRDLLFYSAWRRLADMR